MQLSVPGLGTSSITALMLDDTLYLPVIELFDALHVKAEISGDDGTISGFIEREERPYRIDPAHGIIDYGTRHFVPDDALMTVDRRAYLRRDLFGDIFGLNCAFDYRGLTVTVTSQFELPAVRQLIREKLRKNLQTAGGVTFAGRTIARTGRLFDLGVLDWGLTSSTSLKENPLNAYSIGLGGEIAGGELTATVAGSSGAPLRARDLNVRLRFVGDEGSLLRQTTIGRLGAALPFPYNKPLIGAQITNASPVYRKAFGSYTISDRTEPGWTVELYINRQLVDFTTADATGYYRFDVPIGYGSTGVMLRFYGPWGEERTMERFVRIPFTFLPAGEVEYNVAGGALDGDLSALFARAQVSAGVYSGLTLGAGAMLDAAGGGRTVPFVNGAMRMSDNLLLSGDYKHGLEGRGVISYNAQSQLGMELSYLHLDAVATPDIARQNSDKLALGVYFPLDIAGTRAVTQLDLHADRTAAETRLGGTGSVMTSVLGVPFTLTSAIDLSKENRWRPQSLTVGLRSSLLTRMFGGVTSIRPAIELDALRGTIAQGSIEIEHTIANGIQAGASIGRDFAASTTRGGVALRFDLPFARSSVSATADDHGSALLSMTAYGSVAYDTRETRVMATNRSGLGRGAITVVPFLDLNYNGVREEDEPRVHGLGISIDGGVVDRSSPDSLARVMDLVPYRNYVMTVSGGGFENIAWQPRHTTYQISAGANGFQTIEIPVVVGGEISGVVKRLKDGTEHGMSGVTIRFTQTDGDYRDSVVSSTDGEYFHLGLPPGHYRADTNPEQMRALGLAGGTFEFDVLRTIDGDVLENREMVVGG